MRARPIFHGWKIVGAGAAIQALQAALFLHGFGNYAVVLEQHFGWSKTQLSLGYSFTRFESALLGPIQGWALDRFGTRRIMQAGVVTLAIGFALFSRIQGFGSFFAALVVIAVGASLSGFLSVTTAAVRWFERRRARALSLATMGFALGGMSAPAVVFVLERLGWRDTALLSGVIVLVVGFPLTLVFGGTPADRGEYVDGIDPADLPPDRFRAEGLTTVDFTARQAMRTRAFWMISLGHGSALFVVGAVVAHLSLYLTTEQGFSLQQASFVGGTLPLFQLLGMLIGGSLGDRMNKRVLASGAMLGHMAGLLLLTYATNPAMVWAFAPIHGLSWGIRGPLMQALRADYFGATSFGSIMGFSSLIVMLGTAGGPLIAGYLADVTDSYRLGFTILALAAGAGLTFFVLATPPDPPDSIPGPASVDGDDVTVVAKA
ncbi:MAG: MFS transporter [Acidimicrobiales bacterium]